MCFRYHNIYISSPPLYHHHSLVLFSFTQTQVAEYLGGIHHCFPFSHIEKKQLQFNTFRGFNIEQLESYNWHLIKVFWHLRSVHFKAQCKVHFIQDVISESKLHLKLCKVQSTSNGKIALSWTILQATDFRNVYFYYGNRNK